MVEALAAAGSTAPACSAATAFDGGFISLKSYLDVAAQVEFVSKV